MTLTWRKILLVVVLGCEVAAASAAETGVPVYDNPKYSISAHPQFNHYRDMGALLPSVTALDFSSTGKYLVTAGLDRAVRRWNPIGGSDADCWVDTRHKVKCLGFSKEGSRQILARGGRHDYDEPNTVVANGPLIRTEGCVYIVDFAGFETAGIIVTESGAVTSIGFSKNGVYMAAGTTAGTCEIWETYGTLLTDFDPTRLRILKHDSIRRPVLTAFAPNKTGSFVTANARIVKLWDVARDKPLATLQGSQPAVFSPGGDLAFHSLGHKHTIEVWDGAAKKRKRLLMPTMDSFKAIGSDVSLSGTGGLAFSNDGRLLAQGYTRVVAIWSVPEERLVALLDAHPDSTGAVTHLAFSSTDFLLATAQDGSPEVLVWDLNKIVSATND